MKRMSVNQTIDASKMLGALELANPVTITSESGVLTLASDSNSFVAEGTEAITSITGVDQGLYVITWNTARTLTYNASALVLVGQADKTTAVGDVGVYQINSGVVTELLYQPVAGYAAASHVHDVATESSNGFMSSADKTKLDGIATGAEVNQDAFSKVLVGDTTIAADSETATVTLAAGTNIALTADAENKKVTIAVDGKVASAEAADTAAACTGNAATATYATSAGTAAECTGNAVTATLATTATTAAACSGNSATATKLATARTISLTGDVTGSGSFDGSGDLSIATTGVEAAKLTTARTIALTGAVTGSGTFDGSGDLSITTSAGTTSLPTGAIVQYGGSSAPTGYFLCNGSAVSRTTYASLYAVIGTTYGTGDGSTTFNLPNLKDKFVLGKGSTYATLAATGGETTHTLTTSEMPTHLHYNGLADNEEVGFVYGGTTTGIPGSATSSITTEATSRTYQGLSSSTGGSSAHNNMPPYIVLNYCIKY